MSFRILAPRAIEEAYNRIRGYVKLTRLVESEELNNLLGHRIRFKLENEQNSGAFKIRGVMNALLAQQEQGNKIQDIVAYSSGNHGHSIAWAAKLLDIPATIYLPPNTSQAKQNRILACGAQMILANTRQEAEDMAAECGRNGSYFIHPSDDDLVIAGNGTACYEALQEVIRPSAVFAACGGGGLVSGSYLATKLLSPQTKLFAAEPKIANDVARSVRNHKIFRFKDSPKTIADGARTLGVTPRIFYYLNQIDGLYEIDEEEIIYWTIYLTELLKINCEPTAVLPMAAAFKWLSTQNSRREIIVIISGGNVDDELYAGLKNNNKLNLIGNLLKGAPS